MIQTLFLLVCVVVGLAIWYEFVICDDINTDF